MAEDSRFSAVNLLESGVSVDLLLAESHGLCRSGRL